ncbi:uncharacterized protein LOC110063243 [Orbicella faveolata]|uniref:uncharacterized protein LOC110063243 n=1 Tax=Orbicella faveolata TaxID=48498 RepID=UPI0009E52343|nr:uncharacterized protein LOC110063243 [Orbicella faveolata]
MQRSYEELRESLEFTQSKMEKMAKNNSAFQEQMKEMAKTNLALQRRMTQLESDLEKKNEENAKFEKKLDEIFMQLDDLEQYTRKFNLEIHGIPETDDEEPEDLVLGLAKLTEIDLTDEDIGRKQVTETNNCAFQQLLQQRANVPRRWKLR